MPTLQGKPNCRMRLDRKRDRLPGCGRVARSALASIGEVRQLAAMRVEVTAAASGSRRHLQIGRQDSASGSLLVALLTTQVEVLADQGKRRAIVIEGHLGGAKEAVGDVAA